MDFNELPEYVKTKAELNEYLYPHKKAGIGGKGIKKEERDAASDYFDEHAVAITAEAIDNERRQKANELVAIYPEGDIKLFVAKHWTLEYEIAKSGIHQELAIAVLMAKAEQAGKNLSIEEATKDVEVAYKDGTNDAVAYKIFKPINDGTVSKAIVAQYLATIIESGDKDYKNLFETDECLAYLTKAINHVTAGV